MIRKQNNKTSKILPDRNIDFYPVFCYSVERNIISWCIMGQWSIHGKKEVEARLNKAGKAIWNTVTWLLVICFILLAVALAGVRFLGYTPYAILSASMTPEYQVGDLAYVRETPPEDIEPGDVITFVANEDLLVVTHSVVEADRENRWFITQGIANAAPDAAPVLYENVLGVVKFSLPKLGYISMYLSTATGKYVGIAVGAGLLLLLLLPEFIRPEKKKAIPESPSPEEDPANQTK